MDESFLNNSKEGSEEERTETFDFKLQLLDLLKLITSEFSKLNFNNRIIDKNLKDKVFNVINSLSIYGEGKFDKYIELLENVENIVNTNSIGEAKAIIEEVQNYQSNLENFIKYEKVFKNKLRALKEKLSKIDKERIRIEDIFAREKEKRGGLDAPPEIEKYLEQIDSTLKSVEQGLESTRQTMQMYGFEESIDCQVCQAPAQFVCSIYYCGERCQSKHLQ